MDIILHEKALVVGLFLLFVSILLASVETRLKIVLNSDEMWLGFGSFILGILFILYSFYPDSDSGSKEAEALERDTIWSQQ